MGENGNKKNEKSKNDRYLAKIFVYYNYLMMKTVFIIMILKIKQYKKYTFGNFWKIKVRYLPWIWRSTQNILIVKATVDPPIVM